MTTQSTTTKEALEPCPFCGKPAKFEDGGFNAIRVACSDFDCEQRRRVHKRDKNCHAKLAEHWNSRVSAPIVAPDPCPQCGGSFNETGGRPVVCQKCFWDNTRSASGVAPVSDRLVDAFRDAAIKCHIGFKHAGPWEKCEWVECEDRRKMIQWVTTAPVSTVAPQQSEARYVTIDGERRQVIPCPDGREDCEVLHTAPASPDAPKSLLREPVKVDASLPLVVTRDGVPCPDQQAAVEEFKEACRTRAQALGRAEAPAAVRDEAGRIPQTALHWLKAAKDESHSMAERLFYMENAYNHAVNALYATTPPSTLAKAAADLFPKTTYKNKRQLADKERFKLNAALNDYLFNNCDHEHDGYPNHLACRWCALEIIAAIIERLFLRWRTVRF